MRSSAGGYMKKIYELGEKTGLTRKEVGRVVNLGALGLLALGLTALAGCLKIQKHQAPDTVEKPQTLQNYSGATSAPAGASGTGTGGAEAPAPRQKPAAGENCGPYPGYPCGTRYYTVSRADFRA